MEYIPIGSVVILKGGNIKLMIYGRKQILITDDERNGQMYDYLAVPYPEGFIAPEFTYAFNHNSVDNVLYSGMTGDEEKEFQKVLENASVE